ncbi:MAG TPA: insulinase family protein [Candidatus Eremiobacteraceae bacterium]
MTYSSRGALAALFFSTLLLAVAQIPAVAAGDTASQLTQSGQRPDGLTYRIIGGGASPTEAIEIWFRCPADGYDGSRPGIARLAALAIADDNRGGASLRDIANASGGEVAIQVFPAATEIGIVVPAYLAGAVQDAMLTRIFHPSLGDDAIKSAKLRMAEQLSLAGVEPDIYLRERLFASIFANGPYRDSTFGTAATLDKMSLTDVQEYIADAFRPANAIVASAGLGSMDVYGAIATSSATTGQSQPLPHSSVRTSFEPVVLPVDSSTSVRAVALGWVGPPISDQRAATAMDFLSDYLMRDGYGTAALALAKAQPESEFDGQFITLQDPGIMFVGMWGTGLDRRGAVSAIRAAVQRVVDAPLSDADFARASIAFQTHLLHDMDGPQPVADNVGWYFAQGATAYTPVDMIFGTGGYEAAARSLTPGFVHDIARRYLSPEPAVVTSPDTGGSIAWIAPKQGDR